MQLQHCKGHLVWGAKRWLPGSYRVDQGWSQDVKPGSIASSGSSQRRGKNWRLVADNVDRACCEESIRSCFCDSPRLRLFSRSPWRSRRLVCCLVSSEYRLSQSSSQQCKTMQSNICVARLNVNGYGRRPFDHSQQAIGGVAADSLPSSHVSRVWRLKLGDRRLRRQTQILCDWQHMGNTWDTDPSDCRLRGLRHVPERHYYTLAAVSCQCFDMFWQGRRKERECPGAMGGVCQMHVPAIGLRLLSSSKFVHLDPLTLPVLSLFRFFPSLAGSESVRLWRATREYWGTSMHQITQK